MSVAIVVTKVNIGAHWGFEMRSDLLVADSKFAVAPMSVPELPFPIKKTLQYT